MRTQTASASAASVSPERITWARLTELRPSRVIQVPVRTRPGKFSSARKSMPRRAMTKNRFAGSVGSKRVRNRLTRPLSHKVREQRVVDMAVGVGVAEAQHVLGPDDARVGDESLEL